MLGMSSLEKKQTSVLSVFPVEKWIPREAIKSYSINDGFSDELLILQHFDLNWKYGPCVNITRLQRWKRAHDLGLDPPRVVKDLIDRHSKDPKYTACIWSKYHNLM